MQTAVLRASLLVLASSVHAQSPTRSLGGLTPRAPRSSALLSTQDMFAFWCNAEREKSPLCQQHVRTAKLGALQKQARARHAHRTPHAVVAEPCTGHGGPR
jgi:hypothetical protein